MSDVTGTKSAGGNITGTLREIHPSYKIDTTLTYEGYAADAKATGDAIRGHEANTANPHNVTVSQVGARPDTWLPTITEIGAAPAGYGYGGTAINLGQLDNEAGLNTALDSVYGSMGNSETKLVRFQGYPSSSDYNFYGILSRSSATYGSLFVQSAYNDGLLYTKARRSGAWQGLKSLVDHVNKAGNPRNLLDNSYFVNPVCQRGTEFKNGVTENTIDRWKSYGAVTVEAGKGIKFVTTSTTYFYQYFEAGTIVPGKTYTMACELQDGTIHVASGSTTDGKGTNFYLNTENTISLRIAANYNSTGIDHFAFCHHTGMESKLKWLALYEGAYTIDTLPKYQPKGYAAELTECLRYYQRSNMSQVAILTDSTLKKYENTVNFYIPMRIAPTVTLQYDFDSITLTEANNCGFRWGTTRKETAPTPVRLDEWEASADL